MVSPLQSLWYYFLHYLTCYIICRAVFSAMYMAGNLSRHLAWIFRKRKRLKRHKMIKPGIDGSRGGVNISKERYLLLIVHYSQKFEIFNRITTSLALKGLNRNKKLKMTFSFLPRNTGPISTQLDQIWVQIKNSTLLLNYNSLSWR